MGLYALYCAAMIWLHPGFIYPFQAPEWDHPAFVRHDLSNEHGELTLYYYPGRGTGQTVVYYMGNVGNLPAFTNMLAHYANAGHGVVALGYRGGGGLSGAPSEEVLKADALTALDWAQANSGRDQIVVHGYSLGTGLAVHVAARRDVDGVILTAPYRRLCRIMALRSGVPACQIPMVQRWRSDLDAPQVTEPVYISHGEADTLIPIAEGRSLSARFPNATFVAMPGVGHIDMLKYPEYLPGIDQFLAGL